MTPNKDERPWLLRISDGGNRIISLVCDLPDEDPDLLRFYREFAMTTDVRQSPDLYKEFANWLCAKKSCERLRVFNRDFIPYDPQSVRDQII